MAPVLFRNSFFESRTYPGSLILCCCARAVEKLSSMLRVCMALAQCGVSSCKEPAVLAALAAAQRPIRKFPRRLSPLGPPCGRPPANSLPFTRSLPARCPHGPLHGFLSPSGFYLHTAAGNGFESRTNLKTPRRPFFLWGSSWNCSRNRVVPPGAAGIEADRSQLRVQVAARGAASSATREGEQKSVTRSEFRN